MAESKVKEVSAKFQQDQCSYISCDGKDLSKALKKSKKPLPPGQEKTVQDYLNILATPQKVNEIFKKTIHRENLLDSDKDQIESNPPSSIINNSSEEVINDSTEPVINNSSEEVINDSIEQAAPLKEENQTPTKSSNQKVTLESSEHAAMEDSEVESEAKTFLEKTEKVFSKHKLFGHQSGCWNFFDRKTFTDTGTDNQWKLFINPNKEKFLEVLDRVVSSQKDQRYVKGKIIADDTIARKGSKPAIEDPCEPKMLLYFGGPTGFLDFKRAVASLEKEFKDDMPELHAPEGTREIHGRQTPQWGPSFTKKQNNLLFYTQGGFTESGRDIAVKRGNLKEVFDGENYYLHKGSSDPLLNSLPPFLKKPLDKKKLKQLEDFLNIISENISHYTCSETLETLKAIEDFMEEEKNPLGGDDSSFDISKASNAFLKQRISHRLKIEEESRENSPPPSPSFMGGDTDALLFMELSKHTTLLENSQKTPPPKIGSPEERLMRGIENSFISKSREDLRILLEKEEVSNEELGNYLGIPPIEVELKDYLENFSDCLLKNSHSLLGKMLKNFQNPKPEDKEQTKKLEKLKSALQSAKKEASFQTILSHSGMKGDEFLESMQLLMQYQNEEGMQAFQELKNTFEGNREVKSERLAEYLDERGTLLSDLALIASHETLPADEGFPTLKDLEKFIDILEKKGAENQLFTDLQSLLKLQNIHTALEKAPENKNVSDRLRKIMESGVETSNLKKKQGLQSLMNKATDLDLLREITHEKLFKNIREGELRLEKGKTVQEEKVSYIERQCSKSQTLVEASLEEIRNANDDEERALFVNLLNDESFPKNFTNTEFQIIYGLTKKYDLKKECHEIEIDPSNQNSNRQKRQEFLEKISTTLKKVSTRQSNRLKNLANNKAVIIPRYFHATPDPKAAVSIANTGIEYGPSSSATGTFISTKPEMRYGSICFALPEEVQFDSDIERSLIGWRIQPSRFDDSNSPVEEKEVWSGLKDDININPQESLLKARFFDVLEGSLRRYKSESLDFSKDKAKESQIMTKLRKNFSFRSKDGEANLLQLHKRETLFSPGRMPLNTEEQVKEHLQKNLADLSLTSEESEELSQHIIRTLQEQFAEVKEGWGFKSEEPKNIKAIVAVPDKDFEEAHLNRYNMPTFLGCKYKDKHPMQTLESLKESFKNANLSEDNVELISWAELETELFFSNQMGTNVPKKWYE